MNLKTIIKPYLEEGLVSEQKHPELDLWIYNYTKRCQYDRKWNDITMMCRGLILDGNGNIIARPFKKFVNYEEHLRENKEIPNEHFEVYEKLDGSLGILFFVRDEPRLATRGSFTSEQAIKGMEMLKAKNYPFDKKYTYLFEIIYPANRIVIDYKGKEGLVLLAVIETATGKELPLGQFKDTFEVAKRYDGIRDISKLKATEEANREGYVIRFASGLRLKLKFEEYVRLHRLITETNTKRVWEYLKDGQPVDELLERVPDEFFKWVRVTIQGLKDGYSEIEEEAKKDYGQIKHLKDRKQFAQEAVKQRTKKILFMMLDGDDYSNAIWNMIKPKAERPFKEEI